MLAFLEISGRRAADGSTTPWSRRWLGRFGSARCWRTARTRPSGRRSRCAQTGKSTALRFLIEWQGACGMFSFCSEVRMAGTTAIEWTDATWNPVTGCTKISAGCDHCYAAHLANTRLEAVYKRRLPVHDTEASRSDPFAVRLWPERMTQPERWKDRRMIFVNSMSDL